MMVAAAVNMNMVYQNSPTPEECLYARAVERRPGPFLDAPHIPYFLSSTHSLPPIVTWSVFIPAAAGVSLNIPVGNLDVYFFTSR